MLETKDKKLKYSREYYAAKREEIIEQKKKYRQQVREEVLLLSGGKCKQCGHTDLKALTVVGEVRGRSEGYTTYWNRLFQRVNGGEVLNVLCANCREVI